MRPPASIPPISFSYFPSYFSKLSFVRALSLHPRPVERLNRDIRGTAAHSFAHSHTTLVHIHSLIHSFNTFVLHEDTGRLSRRYAPGNLLTVLYNVITSISLLSSCHPDLDYIFYRIKFSILRINTKLRIYIEFNFEFQKKKKKSSNDRLYPRNNFEIIFLDSKRER